MIQMLEVKLHQNNTSDTSCWHTSVTLWTGNVNSPGGSSRPHTAGDRRRRKLGHPAEFPSLTCVITWSLGSLSLPPRTGRHPLPDRIPAKLVLSTMKTCHFHSNGSDYDVTVFFFFFYNQRITGQMKHEKSTAKAEIQIKALNINKYINKIDSRLFIWRIPVSWKL